MTSYSKRQTKCHKKVNRRHKPHRVENLPFSVSAKSGMFVANEGTNAGACTFGMNGFASTFSVGRKLTGKLLCNEVGPDPGPRVFLIIPVVETPTTDVDLSSIIWKYF